MKTIETERKVEEAIVLSNLITVRNFTSPFVQQFVSYSHKFQSKTIGLVNSRWLGLRTPCSLYYCCPSNMPRERKSEQRLVTILFRSGLSNLITIPDWWYRKKNFYHWSNGWPWQRYWQWLNTHLIFILEVKLFRRIPPCNTYPSKIDLSTPLQAPVPRWRPFLNCNTHPAGSSLVFTMAAILIKSSWSVKPTGVVLKAPDNFTMPICSLNILKANGKFIWGSMFDPIDMWTSFHSKSSKHRSIVTEELSEKRREFGL